VREHLQEKEMLGAKAGSQACGARRDNPWHRSRATKMKATDER
jgi:hypothetical protein